MTNRVTYYKKYYKKNKKKMNYNRKEQLKIWRKKNPEKSLFYAAKLRAKKKNWMFTLEITDIIIPKYCPVLGIELHLNSGQKGYSSPTLDRTDNTKGYIKGNVMVISHRANALKSNATVEEIEKLYAYLKQIPLNQDTSGLIDDCGLDEDSEE